MKPGVSYYIEPSGELHEVQKARHNEFAEVLIRTQYPHLLKEFSDGEFIMYVSDACKDILTGVLHWISFTPLGDNSYVGYIGRKKNNEEKVWIRFSKPQIKALEKLWKINDNKPENFEDLIEENETIAKTW